MDKQPNGLTTNNNVKDDDQTDNSFDRQTKNNVAEKKTDGLNGKWSLPDGDVETRVNLLPPDQDGGSGKEVVVEHDKSYFQPQSVPHLDVNEYWTDEDEEEDIEAKKVNVAGAVVITIQQAFLGLYVWLKIKTGGYLVPAVCLVAYLIYFILAMIHEFGSEASIRLLVSTILGFVVTFRHTIWRGVCFVARKLYGHDHLSNSHEQRLSCSRFFLRWAMYGLVTGVIIWTLIDQGMKDLTNLRSVPGLFLFCLVCFLFSTNPSKVNWHTIFWGIGLQFLAALVVLKFHFGQGAVMWVQSRLDEFFANSEAGSKMLFGESYKDHYMVFGALPIIFLSNATLTVLYYTGAMPFIINTIGCFLSFVLETSPVENMSVAAGIFLEGITAILSLRPYLQNMSKSQLFLVITSAFASLGGAYLAILSSMGVSLRYLIPAMLVSAPATFAVCKLMVPETKLKRGEKMTSTIDLGAEERAKYSGLMDAAQTGATSMLAVVSNIVVVAFVFFSYIEWFNKTLDWFGQRVGVEGMSIELISSYVFYPVALAMGIELVDCNRVGLLMGYRLGVSNIIAFFKLTDMKKNRQRFGEYMLETNGTGPVEYRYNDIILQSWNETLKNGFLTDRSEAIITYALCGFSSFLTVAITMGIMLTLVPHRKAWITRMSVSALIAGNVANCMTGCFASIFY